MSASPEAMASQSSPEDIVLEDKGAATKGEEETKAADEVAEDVEEVWTTPASPPPTATTLKSANSAIVTFEFTIVRSSRRAPKELEVDDGGGGSQRPLRSTGKLVLGGAGAVVIGLPLAAGMVVDLVRGRSGTRQWMWKRAGGAFKGELLPDAPPPPPPPPPPRGAPSHLRTAQPTTSPPHPTTRRLTPRSTPRAPP